MSAGINLSEPVEILGVRVDRMKLDNLLAKLIKAVEKRKKVMVVTPNPEIVLLAQQDEELRKSLNGADVAIPDGFGLVLASWWSGNPIPEQVSGDVLALQLIKVATERNWRIFLLGGKNGVALKAKLKIEKQIANIKIQSHSGAMDIAHETSAEQNQIIEAIKRFKPHLLLVAYGAPWQENWLAKNWKNLNVNLAMGVGGTLDEIAGVVSPTPDIFRRLKLRWLWRLITQPGRWRRIWKAVVVFPMKVLFS
jgi:N-acetylglucosaminyldiphosphoundecaprenol N-acetyl-beta-D-mannosaminyltransferase